MLRVLQGAALVAATMSVGLMAGVFGLYAHIMPGLGRTDDRTFVGAFQSIDRAAGDPDQIADLAVVRDRFDEARWIRWNVVRAVATTAAFGCLTWTLVLYGRE